MSSLTTHSAEEASKWGWDRVFWGIDPFFSVVKLPPPYWIDGWMGFDFFLCSVFECRVLACDVE